MGDTTAALACAIWCIRRDVKTIKAACLEIDKDRNDTNRGTFSIACDLEDSVERRIKELQKD